MHITTNTLYLAFLLVSAGFTHAIDNTPCVSGSCSHSGGDNVKSLVHSISINGSQELIGDVTQAAGWNIQGCDPNWSSGNHTVIMTCEGSPDQTQYCDHVFNGGVENTIVRLPENCGTGPFARIVSIDNGTDGVYTMQLDYNFTQIPESARENVTFEINFGNSEPVPSSASTALQPRFTKSASKTFPIGPFQKSETLLNKSASCDLGAADVELDLNVDVTGTVNGSVTLNGTITGSFVIVKTIVITADIEGTVSMDLNINAGLLVSTTTGDQPFFSLSIPDLTIPGVITLGPELEIDSRVDVDASLQSTAIVHTQWDINSIHIVFPSSAGASSRSITPTSSDPIHMSTNPSLAVGPSISVTGHIIPKFRVGVDAHDSGSVTAFAEADCFLSFSTGIQSNFGKRDYSRDLFKRGTVAMVSVDAGVSFDVGVEGSIGPFSGGNEIQLATLETNLFNREFGLAGPPARREVEAPRVFKRDDDSDTTECPSANDIVASLQKLI